MYKKALLALTLAVSSQTFAANTVKEARRPSEVSPEDFNIQLGDFLIDAGANLRLGFDDNPTSSVGGSEDAVYQQTTFSLRIHDNKARYLNLSTDLEIGYKSYLKGDGNDGLILNTSGETLSMVWDINETLALSFHDIAKVNIQNIEDTTADEDSDSQRLFDNTAAVQLYKKFSEDSGAGLRVGYRTVDSLNDDFKEREREDLMLNAAFEMQVTDRFKLSPFVSFTDIDFKTDENNDGKELQAGFESTVFMTPRITFHTELFYQNIDLDLAPASLEDDTYDSIGGSVAFSHRVSDDLNHMFKFVSRERISNDTDATVERLNIYFYQVDYQAFENLMLTTRMTYLDAEQKNTTGEKYELFIPSFKADYKVTEKLNTYCELTYTDKTSESTASSYDRSRVEVGIQYDF